LALAGGTLALTLPAGIVLAALLYRSDLPGRVALRRLNVVALFVPLPLFATAWQAAVGVTGPARPWATGLAAAVWVHAAAALPPAALTAVVVALAAARWDRTLPPLGSAPGARPLLALGRWRRPVTLAAAAVVGVGFGVPVGALVECVGRAGPSGAWSAATALQ